MVFLVVLVVKLTTTDGKTVEVEVSIDQPDCKVYVDGKTLDIHVPGEMKPIKVQVDEGRHELKVVKGGFETFTREFTYRKGKDKPSIQVRLVPTKVAGGGEAPPGPPTTPPRPATKPAGETAAATDRTARIVSGKWKVAKSDYGLRRYDEPVRHVVRLVTRKRMAAPGRVVGAGGTRYDTVVGQAALLADLRQKASKAACPTEDDRSEP